jgi:hypothetical protein
MSETPKDTSSAAEGQADHLPEGYFPGIEQLATTVIASFIAKHGPAVGGAMYKALKGDDVLFVQIEKSWKDADYYYIALKFRNLIEHGVYLEDIYVLIPNDAPLAVFKSGRNSMDFSNEDATGLFPANYCPGYYPPKRTRQSSSCCAFPTLHERGTAKRHLLNSTPSLWDTSFRGSISRGLTLKRILLSAFEKVRTYPDRLIFSSNGLPVDKLSYRKAVREFAFGSKP